MAMGGKRLVEGTTCTAAEERDLETKGTVRTGIMSKNKCSGGGVELGSFEGVERRGWSVLSVQGAKPGQTPPNQIEKSNGAGVVAIAKVTGAVKKRDTKRKKENGEVRQQKVRDVPFLSPWGTQAKQKNIRNEDVNQDGGHGRGATCFCNSG